MTGWTEKLKVFNVKIVDGVVLKTATPLPINKQIDDKEDDEPTGEAVKCKHEASGLL